MSENDKKSLQLRLTFRSSAGTLTKKQVNEAVDDIVKPANVSTVPHCERQASRAARRCTPS
jgi:hypothetical protein